MPRSSEGLSCLKSRFYFFACGHTTLGLVADRSNLYCMAQEVDYDLIRLINSLVHFTLEKCT